MDDPDEFEAGYEPSDSYAVLTDMPDGRTRVIDRPDFAPGDIHESGPMSKPRILDRARRQVVLDTMGRYANFATRWQDGYLVLHESYSRLTLVLDMAGERFREEGPAESDWQPLTNVQALVDSRTKSWRDVFPPPTRMQIRLAWWREYGFATFILAIIALAAWWHWNWWPFGLR